MKAKINILLILFIFLGITSSVAQGLIEKQVNPTIEYSRIPRTYTIGGIAVEGAKNYDDYMLIGLSGLTVGQRISIPGDEITEAVKRFWKNGLFSNVAIQMDSVVKDKAYLRIRLTQRPRVSQINYHGVKKGEREDLEERIGLLKDNQLTPNMIDRAKFLIKKYFDEKGYKNAEVEIQQRDDVTASDMTIVDIFIDKKDKVRINSITIEGNQALSTKKIKGTLFVPGVFKKTNEKGRVGSWFRTKKFIEEKYEEDKENLIAKYNEMGYRDAFIVADSVTPHDEKTVDVYVKVDEGQKYYVRNIEWVGNTIYSTDQLNHMLRMKKGDVYNQKLLGFLCGSSDKEPAS